MSRKFKIAVALATVLLQMTVLAHFKPLGVLPNYMFVLICSVCFISPESENVVWASVTGLFADVISGTPFGLNAIMCMCFSIICANIAQSVYNKSAKFFSPLCFAVSFCYETLFGIFSSLLRERGFNIGVVISRATVVALVNAVIFIFAYTLLKSVKFEKKRKGIKYEQ